jgi:plastocyanin
MTRTTRRFALLVGLVAALALLVTAVASAHPTATAKKNGFLSPGFTLQATLIIRSDEQHAKKGSDGKWHDAFLPASFTALAGVPVKVTVYNYDDMPHSFNAPGLKVNKIIMGGSTTKPSKTTFTFTPTKKGSFAWHCDPKCDPWAMKHVGFMKGIVTVL